MSAEYLQKNKLAQSYISAQFKLIKTLQLQTSLRQYSRLFT